MRVLGIALLVALAACQGQTANSAELTAARRAEIEAEVQQVVDSIWAAAAATDMDAMEPYWSDQDGLCVFGSDIASCEEVAAAYRKAWGPEAENPTVRQEFGGRETRVMAVSPTVAIAATTTQDNRAYRENGDVSRAAFANMFVLVLEDGRWKVQSAQQAGWPIQEDEEEAEAP